MSPSNLIDLEDGFSDVEINAARRFFDIAEELFKGLGFDTAADNLRHYRSGKGETRSYTQQEMAGHPAYGDAIDQNRTRFEGQTFTRRTNKNKELNEKLLNLKDGETAKFRDGWDSNISGSKPSTYSAFGRSGVWSEGDFEATRKGGRLLIQGTVANSLKSKDSQGKAIPLERFDFNPGQIGDRQARALEGSGEASPFDMRYDTQQNVEAELQYETDGTLTLLRSLWDLLK